MTPHDEPKFPDRSLTRRAFLKRVGAGVAAMLATEALMAGAHPVSASGELPPNTPAVLIDLTRCVGCNSCALACKKKNQLPDADSIPQALDSNTYTYVGAHQITLATGEVKTRYAKRQCMHCLEPACVTACPAAAMYKSEEGPVLYRSQRCLGCRYCQIACPFGVPSFEWQNGVTPVISKCWFCYDRLEKGEKPACVAACPTGALRFGQRDALLAQAHAQIASSPDRYLDHVYGEHEMGGTSMLYISDIPFEELGFPTDLPEEAPGQQTEKVMEVLPAVILGVGTLMAGTAAYTHRGSAAHNHQESMDAAKQAPSPKREE